MKKAFTLIFFLGITGFLWASSPNPNPSKGYIVTLNGKYLTGAIGNIFHTTYGSEVTFINDFGTIYQIHPFLIRGFVFREDASTVAYESKYSQKKWLFLRVLHKGDYMSIYKSPEKKSVVNYTRVSFMAETVKNEEYWIELKGKNPININRLGYKKQLRKLINKRTPELADKIGSKGYRFRNLTEIAEEYNKKCQETKYKL
ncbi:MAG: hypothetical protein R2828_26435 [Saprospiraceae bacterium]